MSSKSATASGLACGAGCDDACFGRVLLGAVSFEGTEGLLNPRLRRIWARHIFHADGLPLVCKYKNWGKRGRNGLLEPR